MPRRCSTQVPAAARRDPGYIFARVQWLRKENKLEEAGKLILSVPQNPDALVDPDQWWVERRLLVRKLLDDGHHANRLSRGARRRFAAAGQLPRRPAFHRRLDRLALSARSKDRRRTFLAHSGRHRQPARFGPRRLLARARRRSHGPARAGKKLLRGRGPIYRDLLRPACARAAGLERSRPARTAFVHAARRERSSQSGSRARGRKFSTRSTSATCWRRYLPNWAKAAPTLPAWRRWARSPPDIMTAAPCCCSARAPMDGDCRSTITPTRSPVCRNTSRSHRRSSRRWPIRSHARKATSTRRSSRAPTPWG